MKAGDLVRWSDAMTAWHAAFGWDGPKEDLTKKRKCGIILENSNYDFWVLWESGEYLHQVEGDLEVINEARQFDKSSSQRQ